MDIETLKNFFIYSECEAESEEFETYLNIYLTIKKLFINKELDKQDISILEKYLYGYSNRESAQLLSIDRRTVARKLKLTLDKLMKELNQDA